MRCPIVRLRAFVGTGGLDAATPLCAGRYDRAISDYTEVIRSDPSCGEAYYFRGKAYMMKGDYVEESTDIKEREGSGSWGSFSGPRSCLGCTTTDCGIWGK